MKSRGHESYVTFCQLEDEAAFTCSADCTIRKWDVLTGQCLQVFRGHTSIVNRILVANNQLFSSSYDRTARAWSVDKGQVAREFRGHRNCVLTLAYSAPQDLPGAPCTEEAVARGLLVTGSTDGTAKVWQVASGCCHQTLRGHTGAVLCLVLATPGHTAFTGSTDATVRAWDILSGQQLRVFQEHQGSVICLELVNRHVYSGSADRTVKCWLADTGERVRTFAAHRHSVSALKYHAGTLFTGSGDARARAFDAQSGALRRVFRGHAFIINCIQQQSGLRRRRSPAAGLRHPDRPPTDPRRERGCRPRGLRGQGPGRRWCLSSASADFQSPRQAARGKAMPARHRVPSPPLGPTPFGQSPCGAQPSACSLALPGPSRLSGCPAPRSRRPRSSEAKPFLRSEADASESHRPGLPGGPVVRASRCHCRGPRVRSLVGELRSHKPRGAAKEKSRRLSLFWQIVHL
ncbi:WD repeat-containing protein 86 isoform X2 [Tursiops truncatus]|uniref:WD repeat-containing protein 86 isoform X2 n=1 Tax=Tursiops truncatus TaxID=9739 RepID=UPI003CCFCD81